jgi:hypothetical protein
MIQKLDGLITLLLATILATFLLFSCAAKEAPREIVVQVPANYSGEVSLDPCSPRSSGDTVTKADGSASTSVCPQSGEVVTLIVIRGGVSYRIPPEQVTIQRAGDGLPVGIRARIPEH